MFYKPTNKELEDIKAILLDGEEITIETLEELSNGKGEEEDE